jgi:hypothetical protein
MVKIMPETESFEQLRSVDIGFQDPELEAIGRQEEKTDTGGDTDKEVIFTETELQQLDQSQIIEDLLLSRRELSDNRQAFLDNCREVYSQYFQDRSPHDAEDAERKLNHFITGVERIGNMRDIVAAELLPPGTEPSPGQKKIIMGLSMHISDQLGLERAPAGASPEDNYLQAVNINPDQVKAWLRELNIRLVDELPDDEFNQLNGDGSISVWAESPDISGYDAVSIARQLISKRLAEGEYPRKENREQTQEEASLIDWFREKGVTEDDLHFFRYFKQKDAFAIASIYRDQKNNPQAGGVSKTVAAEYKIMRAALDNNEKYVLKGEVIGKAYRDELNLYGLKWKIIKDSGQDIDSMQLSVNGDDIPDSASSDASSDADETAQSMAGGTGQELKSKPNSSKGERAGGGLKIEGPKNVKEAIFNIFTQADAEFGMNFNPVAQVLGIAA